MLISFMVFSCEPDPELNLPSVKKQLVVDGWIENNGYAQVLLTYNTNYFSDLDSASFRALVASRAKVTISDGTRTEVLILNNDTNYFPPFIYKGNEILGQVGKTYTLLIEDEIDTLIAHTVIPNPIELDSVWYSAKTDSSGIIKGIINDNPAEQNFYRTFTKRYKKDKRYIPTLVASFEDTYFNGQRFTFNLNRGPESYIKPYNDIEFSKKDTVFLRVTTLDKICYSFWYNYDQEILNSGNPFASNFKSVIGNIPGGLGIWCGYGASYYVIIAK